jgi:hypothetical protein
MIDVDVVRNGNRIIKFVSLIQPSDMIFDRVLFVKRSFRPDYVLIRQHVTDTNTDWKSILIGLQYGLIPSTNNLNAVYNFVDRAWVVSAPSISVKKQTTYKIAYISDSLPNS